MFSGSIAVSGNLALIGASLDSDFCESSGAAYVFVRSGSVWQQQQKLLPTSGNSRDEFGKVAISGDTILVGPHQDFDLAMDAGAIYVFVRNGTSWTMDAKFFADDATAGDVFGLGLALSDDLAVVGAYFDDDEALYAGSAYVFEIPKSIDGDYDGDGKSDKLFRNNTSGANQMYFMDGSAITQNLPASTVAATWQVVGRGDYNGDTKSDILWRYAPTGALWIYFMNGNIVSSSAYVGTISDSNWKVVGNGDYNGDGYSDVLWRNVATGSNYMYLMNGLNITANAQVSVVSDQNWKIVHIQ